MVNPPILSVVVPVYGAEPYLDQALESICAQTLKDIEIICLNDGSKDRSLEIMQAHAANDPRIRVIDKGNQGYGATCNRGIDEARGTWIAILEPDDWIEPAMYERMLAFAQTLDAPVDIVKTPYWRIINPDTPQQRKLHCSYHSRIRPARQPFSIGEAAHLLCHHPSIWSAVYRADFLREKGIRFREYPGSGWADNPFLIETLCQTDAIAYLDDPFYCYREETEEKTLAFHKANPLLPIERWQEMANALDALGVRDERVWKAHNSRGFTYLGGILETVGLECPGVREAARVMMERMNEELVLADDNISPGYKRLYLSLTGKPERDFPKLPYLRSLVREGWYTLKNTGPANTLHMVKTYLGTKADHEGR